MYIINVFTHRELEESQKLRKQEIITRILQEEASQAKRKKQTSSIEMSKSRESTKLRAKTLQYIQSAILTEPDEDAAITVSIPCLHSQLNGLYSPSSVFMTVGPRFHLHLS